MTYSGAWRPKTERLEQDLASLKARLEARKNMVKPFQPESYKGLSQGNELMGGVKKALGYVGIDPTLPWNRKRATQEELRQRYEVQQKSFGHGALSPTGMTLIERKPIPGTHDYVYSQPAGGVDPIAGGGVFKGGAAKSIGEVIPVLKNQLKAALGGSKAVKEAVEAGQEFPIPPAGAIKEPWQMTRHELGQTISDLQKTEKMSDLEVFGGSQQKLDAYNRAQRMANSSNPATADKGDILVKAIEDKLTKQQLDILGGVGVSGRSAEELKTFHDAIGDLDFDSPQALGRSLGKTLTDVGLETDPAKMSFTEQLAYTKMKVAMQEASQLGWDTGEITQSAIETAAKRFATPDEARYMLSRYMKKVQEPTQSPPLSLSEGSNISQTATAGAKPQLSIADEIEQAIAKFKSAKQGAKPIDEAEALINKYKQTRTAGGGTVTPQSLGRRYGVDVKIVEGADGGEYSGGVAHVGTDNTPVKYKAANWTSSSANDFTSTSTYPKNVVASAHEIVHGLFSRNAQTGHIAREQLIAMGVPSEHSFESLVDMGGLYLLEPDAIGDPKIRNVLSSWLDTYSTPAPNGGGTVPPKVPPVATAGTPAPNPHIGASGLVQKDFDDMKEVIAKVKSARAVTTQIRKVDRKARVAEAYRILQKETGPDAFQKARSALKGEYETANLSTTPTLQLLDKFKVALRDKVAAGELRLFDGDHAASGLDILKQKLIDPTGPIPQPHQMKALKNAFGPEFGQLLDELSKSKGNKVWNEIGGILNIPRALASTFDMSGVYLQAGLATAGHPVLAARAMKATLKTMFSEKNYAKVIEGVMERPNFGRMMDELGIDITWGKVDWVKGKDGKLVQKVITNLSQKEEAWMSNIIHKVPILGTITKSSERAYNMYLNMMRVGLADDALKSLDKFPTHEDWYKQMGNLINISTGRGNLFGLGSSIKGSLPLLNSLFFSPKLMFSRIEYPILLLNPATSPVVRKAAARDLVAWLALGAGVIGGIKMAAPESEFNIDPRSPDFGKIKVGNTRLDFWSGFSQYIRLTAQLGTASKMIGGEKVEANRGDVLMRFLQGKLAPAPSILWDMLRGQTFMGEAVEPTPEFLGSQAYQRLVSFFIQDVIDAVNDRGASGIPLVLPSFFGANAQTYETTSGTSSGTGSLKIPSMKIPKLK